MSDAVLTTNVGPSVPAVVPRMPVRIETSSRVAPGSLAKAGSSGFSPQFVLQTFAKWWKIIVPVGAVLAAAVASALILTFKPKYEAYALIEINDATPFIAFKDQDNSQGSQYVATQVELIRGPVVLEQVLGEPDVASLPELANREDKVEFLQKRLEVEQVNRSELYRVQYTSHDPLAAQKVVSNVVTHYFKTQGDDEYQLTGEVIRLLEQEEGKRRFDVESLRRNVQTMTKDAMGHDPYLARSSLKPEADLSPIATLSNKLIETVVEREELKAQIKALESWHSYVPPIGVEAAQLDMQVEVQEEIIGLALQVEDLRTAMEVHRTARLSMTPTGHKPRPDPLYDQMEVQLASLEQRLASAKEAVRRRLRQENMQTRGNAKSEKLVELQNQLTIANQRYDMLYKKYEEELKNVQTGSEIGVELQFAKEELEREEKILDMIANRKLGLQTELRAPPRIRLRRSATMPKLPVEDLPYKPLMLGCLLAIAAPLGLAIGWERFVRRVSDPRQLSEESGLPVLGEIARHPAVRIGNRRTPDYARRDLGIVGECIDSLCTSLLLMDRLRTSSVLAVTSAAPQEGKTTVSAQLALSLARYRGEPTLLVDGDARAPDIHQLLELPLSPGLNEVLAGECELEDAIHQVNGSQLFVLTAGKLRGSPHASLSSRIEELVEILRPKFSYVVIDCPPVLSASESLFYARHADSVLFCSMRDVTRVRQVQDAVQRLSRAGASLAGAVLNCTPVSTYLYRYGQYQHSDKN
jgi:capsular exopolysaccharide synthesis family protein